jgi:hypothetical protein
LVAASAGEIDSDATATVARIFFSMGLYSFDDRAGRVAKRHPVATTHKCRSSLNGARRLWCLRQQYL